MLADEGERDHHRGGRGLPETTCLGEVWEGGREQGMKVQLGWVKLLQKYPVFRPGASSCWGEVESKRANFLQGHHAPNPTCSSHLCQTFRLLGCPLPHAFFHPPHRASTPTASPPPSTPRPPPTVSNASHTSSSLRWHGKCLRHPQQQGQPRAAQHSSFQGSTATTAQQPGLLPQGVHGGRQVRTWFTPGLDAVTTEQHAVRVRGPTCIDPLPPPPTPCSPLTYYAGP